MWHLIAALAVCVSTPEDAALDRHALLTPAAVERSIPRLTQYLVEPAKTDRDKARVLFRWVTDRIRYDLEALATDHPGETRPQAVLELGKARALGYAALYDALAKQAGLESVVLPGFAKGVVSADDERPNRPNHAWNAVRIDGKWELLDPTLGAGFVRYKRFHRVFQEQFFLPPSSYLLLTHMPLDPRWQLVPYPIGMAQWEKLPVVDLQLLSMGVSFEMLWRTMQSPGFRGFVRMHAQYTAGKVLAAPLGKTLAPGRDYYFVIEAPQAQQIVMVHNGRSMPLRKTGTRFEGYVRPEPGQLRLDMVRSAEERGTQTMFSYQIEPW